LAQFACARTSIQQSKHLAQKHFKKDALDQAATHAHQPPGASANPIFTLATVASCRPAALFDGVTHTFTDAGHVGLLVASD
jgi:hypothetical protein